MQGAALRLARFLERRSRLVAALWLVVVVVSVPLALRQSEDLTGSGFDVPGSGSDVVRRAVDRDFPDADQAQLAAVLVAQPGGRPAALTTAVGRLETELAGVPAVSIPPGAEELGLRTAASGVVVVSLSTRTGDARAPDVASEVREALQVGEARDGVVAHVIGITAFVDATADVLEEDLASAEAIGFPAVLVILLLVFGSLAAACLPLALAIASVTVTGALIFAVSQVMDVYIVATNLASLVGVGVAVDYSLFILARYREEIRAGREPETAARAGARHLRPCRHLLRRDRDRIARRDLDDRQLGAPLARAGRDPRRGGVGARLDDAPAAAAAPVWTPRLGAGPPAVLGAARRPSPSGARGRTASLAAPSWRSRSVRRSCSRSPCPL